MMNKVKVSFVRGFTLIELLVTIAIMAVLMTFAIPSYQGWLQNNALKAALQNWRESFYYAQTVAMQKQRNITLCASSDGATCNTDDFAKGWIVIIPQDDNPDMGTVLQDFVPLTMVAQMKLNDSKDSVSFLANGRLNSGVAGNTLTITDNNGHQKTLTFNGQGRIYR